MQLAKLFHRQQPNANLTQIVNDDSNTGGKESLQVRERLRKELRQDRGYLCEGLPVTVVNKLSNPDYRAKLSPIKPKFSASCTSCNPRC